MNNLAPDLDATHAFLAALDPDPNAMFGFATFDDRGDDFRLAMRLYGNLDRAVRLTGRKKGQLCSTVSLLSFMQSRSAGVFCTVQHIDGTGAATRNVDGIRDLTNDADTDEQISSMNRFIVQSGLEPSIVVASGGRTAGGADKLQVYWRIHDCPVAAFPELQALLLSRTGTDPAVKDLARVMRLPGFWHLKREPRLTSIVSISDHKYYRSDFERRVWAQPQIAALPSTQNTCSRGVRRSGTATQDDVSGRTARLRALLDKFGGLCQRRSKTLPGWRGNSRPRRCVMDMARAPIGALAMSRRRLSRISAR